MDLLVLLNSAINFILYCIMSQQFRDTFTNLFVCNFISIRNQHSAKQNGMAYSTVKTEVTQVWIVFMICALPGLQAFYAFRFVHKYCFNIRLSNLLANYPILFFNFLINLKEVSACILFHAQVNILKVNHLVRFIDSCMYVCSWKTV